MLLLERAEGYKRLQGEGSKPAVIAERANKSLQQVDRLLILANVKENVKQLVFEKAEPAVVAIDSIIATRVPSRPAWPRVPGEKRLIRISKISSFSHYKKYK